MRKFIIRALTLSVSTSVACALVVHAAISAGCGGAHGQLATPPGPDADTVWTPLMAPPPGYFPSTKAPTPVFMPPQQAPAPPGPESSGGHR
jgi:hypothetical protein